MRARSQDLLSKEGIYLHRTCVVLAITSVLASSMGYFTFSPPFVPIDFQGV
jgi:hypothetical protein